MKHRQRTSLTEKLLPAGKSKAARRALDSLGSYKKTMGIVEKVNLATGKKSIYTTTSNSTLSVKIAPHGSINTTEV